MACANVIFDSFLSSRPGVGQAAGYFLPCGCWGGGPVVMAFICRKSNADGSLLHMFFLMPGLMHSLRFRSYQAAANLAPEPDFEIISKPGLDIKIAAHSFLILCVTQSSHANIFFSTFVNLWLCGN